jgi:hypothetical protein
LKENEIKVDYDKLVIGRTDQVKYKIIYNPSFGFQLVFRPLLLPRRINFDFKKLNATSVAWIIEIIYKRSLMERFTLLEEFVLKLDDYFRTFQIKEEKRNHIRTLFAKLGLINLNTWQKG